MASWRPLGDFVDRSTAAGARRTRNRRRVFSCGLGGLGTAAGTACTLTHRRGKNPRKACRTSCAQQERPRQPAPAWTVTVRLRRHIDGEVGDHAKAVHMQDGRWPCVCQRGRKTANGRAIRGAGGTEPDTALRPRAMPPRGSNHVAVRAATERRAAGIRPADSSDGPASLDCLRRGSSCNASRRRSKPCRGATLASRRARARAR